MKIWRLSVPFLRISKTASDCLIVDHVTLYSTHYLNKIKRIIREKDMKFIMIETGFTASTQIELLTLGMIENLEWLLRSIGLFRLYHFW